MTRHLLLIAEPLLAEGLSRLIQEAYPADRVCTDAAQLQGSAALVIWCPDGSITADSLLRESQRLGQRWEPAPLLLVLPQQLGVRSQQLLSLPAAGIVQSTGGAELLASIETLLAGGRVVQLGDESTRPAQRQAALPATPLGLGQWLLLSGLQQIDAEIDRLELLLQGRRQPVVQELLLQGRCRELQAARRLLLVLWGPLSLAWSTAPQATAQQAAAQQAIEPGLQLSLSQRNAEGTWLAINARLRQRINAGLSNQSGQLLALDALKAERCNDLLLALLDQLQSLRQQLQSRPQQPRQLREHWLSLQGELRQQALRRMASPYVQLPCNGELQAVAETLIRQCQLQPNDPDMPDPQAMLQSLVLGQPLLVDGQLLAPDAPLAVLHLEQLVGNWLLRSADQVSAEVLGCCAAWPELRRYLLIGPLLSTRNLERHRNQLNAQQRWSSWLQRPTLIYESKRQLLTLEARGITTQVLTEPRDHELSQLSWAQQLVTLALESRDALGPQLQGLIEALGRLVVIVLTQVVGRAIGLVGRGIVQGMGRGLQRG